MDRTEIGDRLKTGNRLTDIGIRVLMEKTPAAP
jgi:hypothetical protein